MHKCGLKAQGPVHVNGVSDLVPTQLYTAFLVDEATLHILCIVFLIVMDDVNVFIKKKFPRFPFPIPSQIILVTK